MARPRVRVTSESETGRNQTFIDTRTGDTMTRAQFAREIQAGNYANYHVRVINGVKTPASNPDGKTDNNLD